MMLISSTSIFRFLPAVLLSLLISSPAMAQAQLVQKSGKNWKVNFNIGTFHNDNVAQSSGGGLLNLTPNDSDSAFNWSGGGEYVHSFSDQWSVKGEYQISQTVYADLGQYDALNNSWGLRPRFKINKESFLDFQYYYIWSVAGGNSFSGVNYFGPTYSRSLGKWGLLQARFFYANSNNFRNQARDADEFGGGFDYVYIFEGTANYLGTGYQGSDQDTVGRFDRTKHDFKIKGRYILPYDFHFKGQYKYSLLDYDTFAATGGGIREDNQHNFNLSVSKVIKDQWEMLRGITATVGWNRTTNDSNTLFREYTSNQATFNLSAGF